jgi:hypothetical protein
MIPAPTFPQTGPIDKGGLGKVHGYALGIQGKRSVGNFVGLSDKRGGPMLLLKGSKSLSSSNKSRVTTIVYESI